ncbi:MAG TPA: nicotinate-nucleotide--dimethylbenzimidazole phosphoribosyltransferase [Natronosporangium sp.]
MSWRTLLVIGNAGSGKSEYAESLLADPAGARRIAGSAAATALAEAKPDETLIVDGLADAPAADELVAAVRDCPARLVLLSDEPAEPAVAARNRALADAVDAVVLVVAGLPVRLKGTLAAPVAQAPDDPAGELPDLTNLRDLPAPDEAARTAAGEHLLRLGPASLGALSAVVRFAAGGQRTVPPKPWQQVRVLVLHGDHAGGAAAGAPDSAGQLAALRDGASPLAQLAGAAGATVQLVPAAATAPIEDGPASTDEQTEAALGYGWRLAQQAVDEGVDAIVLGAIGEGAETAAAAVTTMLVTGAEPAALLARVRAADGTIDDQAWMRRCAAVRDAVRRVRAAGRTGARAVLADLGGADLATATGILLGAAARRTPVLLDGPVGTAAALAARSLAAGARHWWLLPDHGQHPTAARGAEALSLTPLFDLRLELGEGTAALAALPLLNWALGLAATANPASSPPAPSDPDSAGTGAGEPAAAG